MKHRPSPEERTIAARAAVPTTPLSFIDRDRITTIRAPTPFDGVWLHATATYEKIKATGWRPDLVKNTIYGAAIYLSRAPWYPDVRTFECVLELSEDETRCNFTSTSGSGNSENDVIWHVSQSGGFSAGRSPGMGSSTQNQRIAKFFLGGGVRAIHFLEHGTEVVAVYDPSCIRVLRD